MAGLIDNSSSDPQMHPTLYFPTGDVIIRAIAKNNNGPSAIQLFRVHTFMLAHHSPVLADMFTLPAASNTNEALDGVPVIDFHDDAKDIEGLLKVLYNPEALPFKKYDPDTPIRMSGTLRLAVKYDIQPLRQRITQHFESDWPKSLHEWDLRNQDISNLLHNNRLEYVHSPNDGNIQRELSLAVDNNFPEAASAVEFAKEFDCHSILPAALYQLATIESNQDWDRVRDPAYRETIPIGIRTARWNLLSRQSLMQVLNGTKKLYDLSMEYLGELLREADACEVYQKCSLFHQHEVLVAFRTSNDPLQCLSKFKHSLVNSQMCENCREGLSLRVDDLREQCWSCLPSMFH